jgi:hypothetical protein
MGLVINTTLRPLYPRERPGTHCIGGWVGPRAGLDGCGKSCPIGIRSPDRPSRSESLYRLSYPGRHYYYYYLPQLCFLSVVIVLTVVQTKQIRINIHKRKNTKTYYEQYKNTAHTSTHITKTPLTYTHPHITKQVQTTTVQGTHRMKHSQ